MTNENQYGSELSLWEKFRLIQEWAPILTFAQAFLAANDPHRKSLIVIDCADWLADKTHSKLDDELVSHLSALLRSKEGEEFLRWAVSKVQAS